MFQRKPWQLSNFGLAGVGLGIIFTFLYFTQVSCDGTGPGDSSEKKEAKSMVKIAGAIVPVLSGNVPSQIDTTLLTNSDTLNRIAFDNFSWQSFIALCWPVIQGQRGVPSNPNDPNTFLSMTNTTPIVWTSYKNQWDLFGQENSTPTPWNDWTNPFNICNSSNPVSHVFGSAKSEMLPGEGDESFSVPLVDQNKNYALFEIRYNKIQYDFIVNNGLYSSFNLMKYQKNNGGAVTMPASAGNTEGSILVKAAWKKLTPGDRQERYYVIDELVYDPVSKQCIKQKMGLVGLHIAQKIGAFPEWVWSSFEQVDNVPGAPNAQAPYSFNNGTNTPPTINGYANMPDSAELIPDTNSRVPVQVTRLNPIPTTPAGNSTVDLNQLYQAAVGNTWMKYYQLVITQWPTNPDNFTGFPNGVYPADCGQPFPIDACVNTTMETYFQSAGDAAGVGGNSCMSCHYQATGTDFSWSLKLRSHTVKK
jgi:hypothetical protein